MAQTNMENLNEKLAQRAGNVSVPARQEAAVKLTKNMSIADMIKALEPEIKKALPSVMTPERFTRIALSVNILSSVAVTLIIAFPLLIAVTVPSCSTTATSGLLVDQTRPVSSASAGSTETVNRYVSSGYNSISGTSKDIFWIGTLTSTEHSAV